MPRLNNFENLIAYRFGRLVVKAKEPDNPRTYIKRWLCECDCGNRTIVQSGNLWNGHTQSCGCLVSIANTKLSMKHGYSGTPTYNCWKNMMQRCYNPNTMAWADYGGRGIIVCDRWRNSFENFLADMGERPSSQYSIDRYPNNDGNYEPNNCRWSTASEQEYNKRWRKKA